MTVDEPNKYAAVDASLGYLMLVPIQALLWTLKRLKSKPDFLVGIETLDDVAFESTGRDPQELLQTKHHRNAPASLTDWEAPTFGRPLGFSSRGQPRDRFPQRPACASSLLVKRRTAVPHPT